LDKKYQRYIEMVGFHNERKDFKVNVAVFGHLQKMTQVKKKDYLPLTPNLDCCSLSFRYRLIQTQFAIRSDIENTMKLLLLQTLVPPNFDR